MAATKIRRSGRAKFRFTLRASNDDAAVDWMYVTVPAVGSGPFHLVSWNEGSGWRMTANKQYWGGTPTIDEVDFRGAQGFVLQSGPTSIIWLREGTAR